MPRRAARAADRAADGHLKRPSTDAVTAAMAATAAAVRAVPAEIAATKASAAICHMAE